MELLKREVESATGIQLKSTSQWLISKTRLREQQETSHKRGSAIVITVISKDEAKKLCAFRLQFGGRGKIIEKYWEARPSSVCMTCCGIGHEQMGVCGGRPAKCMICSELHKVEDHQCGVIGCTRSRRKICSHATVKCANCEGNHIANSSRCSSKHKLRVKAKKERQSEKQSEKEKEKDISEDVNKIGTDTPSPVLDIGYANRL